MNFDTALIDLNLRQFKKSMKKLAVQDDFCLFLNTFLSCLQIGVTKGLINFLYLPKLKSFAAVAKVKINRRYH